MKKFFFLFLVLFLCVFVSCKTRKPQVATSSFVEHGTPRTIITPRKNQLLPEHSIVWTWISKGPNTKPSENENALKSLPKYSFYRGNGAGKIHKIYFDPSNANHVFACSGIGGLFESKDQGKNWKIAGTDQLPISGVGSVVVNSDDSNMWIISTGDPDDTYVFSDGLWLTRDSGENWININGNRKGAPFPVSEEPNDYTYVSEIACDPKDFNRIYVASNKGLFITENALANVEEINWRLVDTSFYYDIEIPKWNPNIVLASGNHFIMSKDRGMTWEQLPLPKYDKSETYKFLRISMELSEADKKHVYAAITNNENHTHSKEGKASFQKFDMDSLKWQEIRSLSQGMNNVIPTRARAFEVSPIDSSLVFAANVQPIYRSTDGGKRFSPIKRRQMHDDIHHLTFDSEGRVMWVAHDGGVSISYDKGMTWISRDNGIGCAMIYDLSVAQQKDDLFLFGAFDTGGNLYRDSLWSHVLWGDGFTTEISYSNPDTMYVSRQSGFVFRSDDGGKSWNKGIKPRGAKAPWYSWFGLNCKNPQTIYYVGKDIYRSFDAGDQWDVIFQSEQEDIIAGNQLFLSETNPNVMYINMFNESDWGEKVFRSFNINQKDAHAVEWERIKNLPLEGKIIAIVPDDVNSYRFWIVYKTEKKQGGVFFFDGDQWINYSDELGKANPMCMVLEKNNNGRVYLGTTYGVFTRDRDDDHWLLLKGLPGTMIRSMSINYVTQKLLVGTDGRGVWEGDLFQD